MQVKTVRMVLVWLFLSACSAFPQASRSVSRSQTVEITHSDLFSVKDWNSTQVRIAGLHLGMSRNEANSATKASGFELVQSTPPLNEWRPCSDYSECFAANAKQDTF